MLAHRSGRGKISGLELGQIRTEWATHMHVHRGKVTRLVIYLDREHALAPTPQTINPNRGGIPVPIDRERGVADSQSATPCRVLLRAL